jgi:hypothetical protein
MEMLSLTTTTTTTMQHPVAVFNAVDAHSVETRDILETSVADDDVDDVVDKVCVSPEQKKAKENMYFL